MEGSILKMGFVLKVKAALVLVFMFLGLAARTEAQGNCLAVSTGIGACVDLLGIDVHIGGNPPRGCCEGLQNITQVSASIGANATCLCIRNSPQLLDIPTSALNLTAQAMVMLAQRCPISAAVNLTASISQVVDCL